MRGSAQRLICIETAVADRLLVIRGPGESYSDVILRLVELEGPPGRSRRQLKRSRDFFHIDQAPLAPGARGGSFAGIATRPRSARGDLAGKDVADASHALDDPQLVGHPLELASEASHVSVERTVER